MEVCLSVRLFKSVYLLVHPKYLSSNLTSICIPVFSPSGSGYNSPNPGAAVAAASGQGDGPKAEKANVEDLLGNPGRKHRPERLVVIVRGPPGAGKTHVTKLLKVCVESRLRIIQDNVTLRLSNEQSFSYMMIFAKVIFLCVPRFVSILKHLYLLLNAVQL